MNTLSIRHPRANELARQIANDTGKPITEVVVEALEEYAAKHPARHAGDEERRARLEAVFARLDAMPRKDPRSAREIMDDFYDEDGLPR